MYQFIYFNSSFRECVAYLKMLTRAEKTNMKNPKEV